MLDGSIRIQQLSADGADVVELGILESAVSQSRLMTSTSLLRNSSCSPREARTPKLLIAE